MKYYYMAFIPVPEGGFSIFSPDFKEIASQGETLEECMEMASDALNGVVEEYAKTRKSLPSPCTLEEAKKRIANELLELNVNVPEEGIIFQMVKAPAADLTPIRISTTVTKYALDIIDSKAKAYGMPRSTFLVRAALAYEG